MTWTIPGLLVFGAHLLFLPLAFVRPRLVFLLVVATAAFRAEKIGPNMISTNQLEGLALAGAAFCLWKSTRPLRLGGTERLICCVYVAILFVRILQAAFYDVGAYRLAQFAYQDSLRPLVFFLAAHLYLRAGGRPYRVVYAACAALAVMIVAVLLEWRFFWSWRAFFGAEMLATRGETGGFVGRFGYRLILGPFGHWVGTGTFLALYLPFALVMLAQESRRRRIARMTLGVLGLACSVLIGGRAAMLGSILACCMAGALPLVRPGGRLNWLPSLAPVGALCLALLMSGTVRGFARQGYDYLSLSLNPGANEGGNLNFRTDNSTILLSRIREVPLIGYGWTVVREPDQLRMPVAWNDFEVNFVAMHSYDLGVPVMALWLCALLWVVARAGWSWFAWRGPERWAASAVIIISAALVPILASNGAFVPQFSQPWLLAVALMTHAALQRRVARKAAAGAAR